MHFFGVFGQVRFVRVSVELEQIFRQACGCQQNAERCRVVPDTGHWDTGLAEQVFCKTVDTGGLSRVFLCLLRLFCVPASLLLVYC